MKKDNFFKKTFVKDGQQGVETVKKGQLLNE